MRELELGGFMPQNPPSSSLHTSEREPKNVDGAFSWNPKIRNIREDIIGIA